MDLGILGEYGRLFYLVSEMNSRFDLLGPQKVVKQSVVGILPLGLR